MAKYLIPRNDLCMSDPMPFSQHWETRIPMRIEELGPLGAALQNSYSVFKPGDLVNVCAFSDKNYTRMTEIASFRIVSCNSRVIETVQITDTVKVPEVIPENDMTSSQNIQIVAVRGAFEVQDGLGNTIELFVDRKQAEEFIISYKKITAPVSQPKPIDRTNWVVKKGASGKWTVRNEAGELIKEFSRREEAEAFINPEQVAA